MNQHNRKLGRLVMTAIVFSAAAGWCGYMAWTGSATTRPLWAMIAVLVVILGAMLFECYRSPRR